DLIDEAASRLRIEIDSMPHEIDEIERRTMQLQIERVSVARESDPVSQDRLQKLDAELAELREKSGALKAQWQAEKAAIMAIGKIKEEAEAARAAMADAERRGDLQKAAELRYSILMELDKKLQAENARLAEIQRHGKMLKEEVDEEDVAETVAKWTGIPVSRLLEAEVQKLVKMEERLARRVVGQHEAIVAVSEAVRRRPYSVVLFDEIEKAHGDVFNVLLQLLDDGRLTDGQGRTVDFRNTVVIMTSNLGSHLFREDEKPERLRQLMLETLRQTLRPEFLNRID